jgi:hypothetical protein
MRWFAAATLLLSACGDGGDARVRIDLAPLWQQAAQSVDVIYVRAFDSTGLQQEQVLTDMNSDVVLEVSAGDLRFEVESLTAARAPSYFGEQTGTISAGDAVIDLLVPVFPAGGVEGTVTVSDSTPIPAGSVVVCNADTPRADADAPNQRELAINSDGTFAGTLLDGATTLTVSFASYSGSAQTTVVREAIASGLTVTATP